MAIDLCIENFSSTVLKALAASTPKCCPRDDPRPSIPAGIQDEIRLNNGLWRRWQVTRDPTLKAEVNRLQRSVTPGSMSGGTTNGVPHWSPQGELLSQTLRKPKPLPTIWRLSFSR